MMRILFLFTLVLGTRPQQQAPITLQKHLQPDDALLKESEPNIVKDNDNNKMEIEKKKLPSKKFPFPLLIPFPMSPDQLQRLRSETHWQRQSPKEQLKDQEFQTGDQLESLRLQLQSQPQPQQSIGQSEFKPRPKPPLLSPPSPSSLLLSDKKCQADGCTLFSRPIDPNTAFETEIFTVDTTVFSTRTQLVRSTIITSTTRTSTIFFTTTILSISISTSITTILFTISSNFLLTAFAFSDTTTSSTQTVTAFPSTSTTISTRTQTSTSTFTVIVTLTNSVNFISSFTESVTTESTFISIITTNSTATSTITTDTSLDVSTIIVIVTTTFNGGLTTDTFSIDFTSTLTADFLTTITDTISTMTIGPVLTISNITGTVSGTQDTTLTIGETIITSSTMLIGPME